MDDFDTQIQCEEIYDEWVKWDGPYLFEYPFTQEKFIDEDIPF